MLLRGCGRRLLAPASGNLRFLSASKVTARPPPAPPSKVTARPPPAPPGDTEAPEVRRPGNRSMMHFRTTSQGHALNIAKRPDVYVSPGGAQAWDNPTQNHVWSRDELEDRLSVQPKHKPTGAVDRVIWAAVRGAYHTFNFVTGYNKKDPSAASCEYRLLILESIAGVPGMVAGSVRHFSSLRQMKRDHGWIHTLLEEAENERMHLLICMKMFQPSMPVRTIVIGAQVVMLPFLTALYLARPKAVHRFVGYLEETAVETYTGILEQMNTEGTQLNKAWSNLPAPNIAKQYYKLSDDAMWPDVLRNIAADETNHRDVNHTFAGMKGDDPSPFIEKHHKDASKAWRLDDN